jgi:hypothetical protein
MAAVSIAGVMPGAAPIASRSTSPGATIVFGADAGAAVAPVFAGVAPAGAVWDWDMGCDPETPFVVASFVSEIPEAPDEPADR